jgi:hypothetical protein
VLVVYICGYLLLAANNNSIKRKNIIVSVCISCISCIMFCVQNKYNIDEWTVKIENRSSSIKNCFLLEEMLKIMKKCWK